MKCSCVVAVVSVLLACSPRHGLALPPPQCSPSLLEEMPPNIRSACIKLASIYELQNAMESYLSDKVGYQLGNSAQLSDRIDGGVKRQDVDHVFLRFGRRR